MGQNNSLSRTYGELLDGATGRLQKAGCDTPKLDARLLLQHVCDVEHAGLISKMGDVVSKAEEDGFSTLIDLRLSGRSVHRIIGHREFFGLTFKLSPDTLEPRPDTECLVEKVLADRAEFGPNPYFADIGTGSGAIVISLLNSLPDAKAVASDINLGALEVAKSNARALGVADRIDFIQSDYLNDLTGSYDFLVSNPPYIATSEVLKLESEVRDWDPAIALDGGADGLVAYREILKSAKSVLKPGGKLYLEIGYDQDEELRGLSEAYGLEFFELIHDLGGRARVVILICR